MCSPGMQDDEPSIATCSNICSSCSKFSGDPCLSFFHSDLFFVCSFQNSSSATTVPLARPSAVCLLSHNQNWYNPLS
uniref:Uncharacterized protein n=1 Tax=Arundo donax TaxID=35708 RepID=A0A0A9A530_ARUDO